MAVYRHFETAPFFVRRTGKTKPPVQLGVNKKLIEKGITDDITVTMDLDGSVNPVGAKTGNMYMAGLLSSLSNTQAHGSGAFDIRYRILRNPNWTLEEKEKLVYDFYVDAEEYDECLDEWEWDIINDDANYNDSYMPVELEIDMLYQYTLDDLKKIYGNSEVAKRIMEEIKFCKLMHKLRPQLWELEHGSKVNVKS